MDETADSRIGSDDLKAAAEELRRVVADTISSVRAEQGGAEGRPVLFPSGIELIHVKLELTLPKGLSAEVKIAGPKGADRGAQALTQADDESL